MSRTLEDIRILVARGEVVVSSHGYEQLDEDAILFSDLETSMPDARPIEDYPNAAHGPSVLALHTLPDGVAHAVWDLATGTTSPAVLVTAYKPDPARWLPDFATRRRR